MALILRSEWLPLLIRAVGVLAAALSGLVGLKVLLRLPEAEGVVLIAVLGWMVFMPLGQLGYGRPVYGWLRLGHETGRSNVAGAVRFLNLFRRQAVLASCALGLLGWAYAARQVTGGFASAVAIFTLGLAALNSGIYQRDMAYALSQERHYEVMELCRRLGLLLGFLAMGAGLPIWGFGLWTLLVGVFTQQRLARILSPASPATVSPGRAADEGSPAQLQSDARRFLFFTANELLLYNLPLVVFTLLGLAPEIVFTSIWLRLFQLLVLPMRLGVDARMNRLVSAYFRGQSQVVRRGLMLNVAGSALLTGALLVVVAQFKPQIFGWLGATTLGGDPYLMPSLAVWGLANTVQHALGSFTLSYGGGFAFASLMSLLASLSTGLAFGVMQMLHLPVGQMFIATGLIYGLSALGYGLHVRGLLKRLPAGA